MAHAVAPVLAQDPEMMFITMYMASAFISSKCASMFAAVQPSTLALLPMVWPACG